MKSTKSPSPSSAVPKIVSRATRAAFAAAMPAGFDWPAGATATMMLGLDGRILFCSDAACELLAREPDELMAQPVRNFFPALRLGAETPGYNIAFMAFWHPDANWREQDARDAEGRTIALEAAVDLVPAEGGPRFVVRLRRRESVELRGIGCW